MKKRLKLALLYGGRSAEHEVSQRSAASVFTALDKNEYEVLPVYIDQEGSWFAQQASENVFAQPNISSNRLILSHDPKDKGFWELRDTGLRQIPVHIIFPVLHGTYGEDGTVQGLMELADIPYVGCGVLASAVGMDKIMMKSAFIQSGLTVGPFVWFNSSDWVADRVGLMRQLSGSVFPVFVKPANLGSSVGITKVDSSEALSRAIEHAFEFDRKILIEDGILGRELEVSVLGNDEPKASVPGEVVSHSEFYDYDEKYHKDTAELQIPAELPPDVVRAAQNAAIRAYKAVDASGLSRVDMFLTSENRIVVNEINTLPGFTSISMYPKLWEVSGLSYKMLLDELIGLALKRFDEKKRIKTIR